MPERTEFKMTPQEVTNDVLARMPSGCLLPELTDHENVEMYKKVCRAVRDHRAGKPPAMRVPLSDIPKIIEDLRAKIREQEQAEEQGQ